jgi:type VI secretion system secreted protein VgrG
MFNIPTANALQSAATGQVNQAIGELLAQFTAAFKQTNRLLRLHTPLGPNVLLAESLKGIETISGAAPSAACNITGYQLQIDALSTNAHLQLKALIGQPILLEIQTDQSRDVLRPFHGHVTAAVAIGSNGGMARYRLTVQPWLAFLGAGRDSAVFQDMNVLTIVQSILTDYQSTLQGQGKLQALWRLDVQDTAAYPIRSLTTQYQESDLQFINRLLAEEGLFTWFEHVGDAANASLGSHTLVIADHNGAFKPLQRGLSGVGAGAAIRFSQSKGVIADDTIDLWSPQSSWGTHAVDIASWDYRSLSARPVSEHAAQPEGTPALTIQDTPGAYAYESAAQGQRLARNHSQALQVARHSLQAAGTVRALAPGQTFSLTGHASSLTGTGTGAATAEHVVLHVIHHARNNLSAQLKATSATLPRSPSSAIDALISGNTTGNAKEDTQQDIFYRNAALVLPVAVAYRASHTNGHGQLIHPKPSASGSQTALVIGVAGQHLSTDRDHRVKVQFAWQRGTSSQSRLQHPAADGHSGAPAADGSNGSPSGSGTTGTWVRVATPLAPIAGANWGSVALPRIGQEVLVTFLGGDIDRPVITGSLYNGQGADNQQSNQVQQGAANATGNAPMWFPGDQEASGKQGKLPGHAHNAVLSGIKSQALSSSQTGQGGYNQIVFDDSPGQSRLGLQSHAKHQGSHAGETELNLGALRQQTDNQRLGTVGYGFELKTHYSGAIRSGSGLLISADKRQGNESGSSSHQMDSKEASSQLQSGQDLIKALTETAQQHKAMLPVLKTTEAKPDKLPVMMSFAQMGKSLQAINAGDAAQFAQAALENKDSAGQSAEKFDEQVQAIDIISGQVLKGVAYYTKTKAGKEYKGFTNDKGNMPRIKTDSEEQLDIVWGIAALEKIDVVTAEE